MRFMIGSASPCLLWRDVVSPPQLVMAVEIPLASITSVCVPILLHVSWISWRSFSIVSSNASVLLPSMYTDTIIIERSGRRSTATVRSADCTGTYSTPMSFRIQSILRIMYLSARWTVGIILVQFRCAIGIVITMLLFYTCGADVGTAPKSLSWPSIIGLCCTILCFRRSVGANGAFYAWAGWGRARDSSC
jgi:hypothetical protein